MRRHIMSLKMATKILLVGILAGLAVVAVSGQSSEDLSIGEISVRRIPAGGADPAQGLERVTAVVGDLLHVRAAIQNTSATKVYDRLRVDFFFTELITNEHGLLGSQTIFSLGGDQQERLPAISVSTAGFTPGFYVFTVAVADPDALTGTAAASQYVASKTQTQDEMTVLVTEGVRIAEIAALETPFEACQFGGLSRTLKLKVSNVGTVDLVGSSWPEVQVVADFDGSITTLDVLASLSSTVSPGDFNKTLTVQLSSSQADLESIYTPSAEARRHLEVVGHPSNEDEPLQLVISVTPQAGGAAGITRELVVPSASTQATIYSEIEQWHFPIPSNCSCSTIPCRECSDAVGAQQQVNTCSWVPPIEPVIQVAVEGSRLFHVVQDESAADSFKLCALELGKNEGRGVSPGQLIAYTSLAGKPLTDPEVVYEKIGNDDYWRVYIGTSSGTIDVYTLKRSSVSGTTVSQWQTGILPSQTAAWAPMASISNYDSASDYPTTHLTYTTLPSASGETSQGILVVSGAHGIVTIDALTGKTIQTVWQTPVERMPAIADGFVWFGLNDTLQGVELLSAGATGQAELVTVPQGRTITTSIVTSDGLLFWGKRSGYIGAYDTSTRSLFDEYKLSSGDIVGLSVGIDQSTPSTLDPIVFATDTRGIVSSVKLHSRFEASTHRDSSGLSIDGRDDLASSDDHTDGTVLDPRTTTVGPVIASNGSADPIFLAASFDAVTTKQGKPQNETLWAVVALNPGTASMAMWHTDAWGERVQFVFKLPATVTTLPQPIMNETGSVLYVVVPGDRLYAFAVKGSISGE